MKKVYDIDYTKQLIKKYNIDKFFDNIDLPFYTIHYEKGEFLQLPDNETNLFQFGVSGEVSIYYIREDGEKYFLAKNNNLFKLGVMELATENNSSVYAEATTDTTVIALPIEENKELLLADNKFLQMIVYHMSQIIASIMNNNVASSSLKDRVINHMKYYCPDNILKGIEKTAFQLHCSDRQLQRVLNDLEIKNIAKKCGKGTYKLLKEYN